MLQKGTYPLVTPKELHNFPVKLDVGGSSQPTGGPNEREDQQLDGVEGIVGAEVGLEEGRYRFCVVWLRSLGLG